ncbi:hypothetical protein Q5H93_02855 [Hymenobacter sp. ASUV-10]|uniref:Uncharacterized protein n=1 Tax=Hymenobacter aranciens TaxID=3063996 RepID=A0ABT9BAT5_9BACT|nr:hypothetical protein [Hymenobacter sp. ASUV-10]MDO7873658.1 hypothetical protein [Hymenobacter sp. ASUV-10]
MNTPKSDAYQGFANAIQEMAAQKKAMLSHEEELEEQMIDNCSAAIYRYLIQMRPNPEVRTVANLKKYALDLTMSLLGDRVGGLESIKKAGRDIAQEPR